MIQIRKGLNLPLAGPVTTTQWSPLYSKQVALLGEDYHGLKPTMLVEVGQLVKQGDRLFEDKKNPGVFFTAPKAGVVKAINRGEKRAFRSLVIECQGNEALSWPSFTLSELQCADASLLEQRLLDSGMWTALRTRPFSKIPAPSTRPQAIFISLLDTQPLAFDPMVVTEAMRDDFIAGLWGLSRFAPIHLGTAKTPELLKNLSDSIQTHEFSGPHPAGLVGTHIHFIKPVNRDKVMWTVGYQDVIAMGKLWLSGQLWTDRIVALTGPALRQPSLVQTSVGARLSDLLFARDSDAAYRTISGSVLGGRTAKDDLDYLGRYHVQVTALPEAEAPDLFPYFRLGTRRHSTLASFVAKWLKPKDYDFTTSTRGETRNMVALGTYESVMPLDILPTQLLRALIVGDLEMAEQLGCLELDEEDLALCSYVCVGKYEYGPILRNVLSRIEKEG